MLLVNKTIKENSVVIIHAIGGMEFVARLKEQDQNYFYVEKVFRVAMMKDDRTQEIVTSLVPFSMLVEPKSNLVYPFNKNAIVALVEAPPEVAAAFTQQTTSLEIPTTGGLIR